MFESWKRSWELVKQSWRVLKQDKELAVFPIVSFIFGVLIAGILASVGIAFGILDEGESFSLLDVILILAFYLGTYFVTIYCQVALVAGVKHRMAGGDPNIRYGLREANKRLGPIIQWTIIAAVVGMIIQALQMAARRNSDGAARIVSQILLAMVGAAWSLMTFFVIPVIAYEGVGGFEAIKRSFSTVKARWGEAVVGNAGIGLISLAIIVVLALVFGASGIALIASGATAAMVIGGILLAIGVGGILLVIAFSSAVGSVYTAVLYEYAKTGKVGVQGFSPDYLDKAFRPAPRNN